MIALYVIPFSLIVMAFAIGALVTVLLISFWHSRNRKARDQATALSTVTEADFIVTTLRETEEVLKRIATAATMQRERLEKLRVEAEVKGRIRARLGG